MPECPSCGGSVQHIHRRKVDRLISYVVPVKRYRCRSAACDWMGNLRDSRRSISSLRWPVWALVILGAVIMGKMIATLLR